MVNDPVVTDSTQKAEKTKRMRMGDPLDSEPGTSCTGKKTCLKSDLAMMLDSSSEDEDDAQNFISILEKRSIIATSSKGRKIREELRILEKGKALNFQVVNLPISEQPNDNVLLKYLLNPIIPFNKFSPDEFLENWEDSMDEEETEEAVLTESASAIGDGGAYADIRKHTDMRGNDSNENEASTESASANKEGIIGKSTDSNQKYFKTPLGGAKKK
ncbi:hypothetical protein FQA39_LY06048 [Lamprigera yunnana]|nr:hypothetical protein FQA39_LY06048 [Lamprigera yunnana]